MAVAFDLKLDTNNDLLLTSGDLTLTTTNTEMCVQTLGITLKTWRGEWFLDTTFGVPYLQQIIGVARKKEVVDKVFLSQIAANEYVDSIKSYSSTYDRDERYYTMTVTVIVAGETVSTSFSTRPSEEYFYPTPIEGGPTVSCSLVNFREYADKLYYFENFEGLPVDTFATWWNMWSGQADTAFTYLVTQDGDVITTKTERQILVETT